MLSTFPWSDAMLFHSEKEKEVIVFLEPAENHFLFGFFFFLGRKKGKGRGGLLFCSITQMRPRKTLIVVGIFIDLPDLSILIGHLLYK